MNLLIAEKLMCKNMVKKIDNFEKRIIAHELEIEDLKIDLKERDKLIESLEEQNNDLNKKAKLLDHINQEQHKILMIQKRIIGQFKSSIIYTFYRVTHTIGETKLGKILQKLIK